MKPSKLSFLKVWILLTVLSAGLWSLSSCQKTKRPSIIVIAVDRLSFNTFSCGDDKQNTSSGLNTLCNEGIRFTHAYTTSTQPAAAVGSLLTGLYPLQHQLHRSFDRLNKQVSLVQEQASHWGYRTLFFGGSPSILKRTGLSAGFDFFDDFSFLEKKTYFLDFRLQAEKFFSLIQDDADAFFSIIYNSELESPNEGESETSKFEKLDEKFYNFFKLLKQKNLWDKNYVIVVGLQGESDATRLNETPFSNLNSENTMITLFVKPPRSKGDEGVSWKVDYPVNIADLGASLRSTLKAKNSESKIVPANQWTEQFPILDFSAAWLNQKQTFIANPRRLLIEAANTWTPDLSLRFAVLNKNLVLIEGEKSKVFNSLTDGLESIDISKQQKSIVQETENILLSLREKNNIKVWKDFKSEWNDWVEANRDYWAQPNARDLLFKKELTRMQKKSAAPSQPLTALLQRYLIVNKRSNDLAILKSFDSKTQLMTTNKLQRDQFFEQAKLQSLNLALENIWGLWSPKKDWLYSDFTLEIQ